MNLHYASSDAIKKGRITTHENGTHSVFEGQRITIGHDHQRFSTSQPIDKEPTGTD
jgi:ribosomal protein L27